MTRHGTLMRCETISFEAATEHPFTWTEATNGTATYTADGLQLLSATDAASSAGGVITTLPWLLNRLKMVEFLFSIEEATTNVVIAMGISTAFNATYTSLTNACLGLVNVGGAGTFATYSDDGTNAVTNTPGETIAVSTWYKLRIDFWQGTKTVSPPSASTGYTATFQLTNSNGFTRRLATSTPHDLSLITAAVSPYLCIRNATGGALGSTHMAWFKQMRYELQDPA